MANKLKNDKAVLIIIAFFFFISSVAFAAEDEHKKIIQQQKTLSNIQKKIKNYQDKKEQVQKKEKNTAKDLQKIGNQIQARKKEVAVYDWNLAQNEKEMTAVSASIEELNVRRKQLTDCLAEEVNARFKKSLVPQFFIFPAEMGENTLQSALENMVDLSIIIFAETFDETLESKKEEKNNLEEYRQKELIYKKSAEEKKNKAQKDSQKKQKLLVQYKAERQKQDKELKKLQEEARSLETLIKKLEGARQKKSFGGGAFSKRKGHLLRPVTGALLKASYGNSSDIYKGIIIKAPRGKEVFCVANGQVIYSDWFRGFGNIVIIDHGGGFSTLYAHLEESLVNPDEQVKEGQVIAKVGDTGSLTTTPRLYFEIRRQGESLDPLEWLER